MIKKLAKYAKMAIALTLIGALALPSYATVGASDGSAFVTKAEFDSALSDFNARLTTFEAGINSKIDSQVSSYLDRNGIWSGRQQEFFPQGLRTGSNCVRPGLSGETDAANQKLVLSDDLRWTTSSSGTIIMQRQSSPGHWANVGRGQLGGAGNAGWWRYKNNAYCLRSMPLCYRANKTGLLVATVQLVGNAIDYVINIEGTHPGAGTSAGVFYFLQNGFLWGVGDFSDDFDLLSDDSTMITTKDVLKALVIDQNQIKSTYNVITSPYNIYYGTDNFRLVEPGRTVIEGTYNYSADDKKGQVLGGGTFVSMFFVQKEDFFWTARFCYASNAFGDWIDYKGSQGNSLNYGVVNCVIY